MAARLPSPASMASLGASLAAAESRRAATRCSLPPLPPRSSLLPSSTNPLRSSPSSPLRLHLIRQSPRRPTGSGPRSSGGTGATSFASDHAQLKSAREDIKELLRTQFCHPIMIRLGWHDAGLINALKLLQPIKDKYSGITYADLFQLASATAVEEAGGPKIPMKYGRIDVTEPEQCPEEGRLPDAGPPSPAAHLRDVFYRMGLDDKEIVALSGAHTLGRSRPERSGWGKPETKYTVWIMEFPNRYYRLFTPER
ncbi:hypothetical protein Taro_037147 [Colocasia esculenta]|uniref:Plant heme peroxidase family profile domain-containing protein n=1 Tax=Colocasia esculenta TaxID=4460 RepID=A0A843VZL5_COLES|nr:hypothetical protein [Colocasia esculenta]